MRARFRDAELLALRRAINELELERSTAQARATLLEELATSLAGIAEARDPDQVVTALLCAARDRLRFERVAYFEKSAGRMVARSQFGFLAGLTTIELQSSESGTPLPDARRQWALLPLVHDTEIGGFLYADRDCDEALEQHVNLLKVLIAVAAAALSASHLYQQLSDLARRDPLTGLLNRRALEERLSDVLERSRRKNTACTAIMLDVDDFKRVNDRIGHSGGDAVLTLVATTLSGVARDGDFVGRLSGDEFFVFLNETPDAEARSRVRHLSRELRRNGLRCSLGAALFPRDASDLKGLMRAADMALYSVKTAGKNGFAFADRRNPCDAD